MPALDVDNPGVSAVGDAESLLNQLLDEALDARGTKTVEPTLTKSDFHDLTGRISSALGQAIDSTSDKKTNTADAARTRSFAVIETAARDLFGNLIATTSIDSPDFAKMWSLLDILSILSDDDECDPALLFWLVEELLDSQTIAGCRKIFDYLESRRERITAKHFKQKQLVILRSCNELLRRLSRAEDTAFCGRVFIFMFQSFPLGDRSSVNLRGEYHVENVTSFETSAQEEESTMDVDVDQDTPTDANTKSDSKQTVEGASGTTGKAMDPDALYPIFWSLQESFSQPLTLFNPADFAKFKTSLDATMKAFKVIYKEGGTHSSRMMDGSKRNPKRKREEDGGLEEPSETFNPKYLTSKDLFQLEISDLSFRRHILVQALIITEFLLSLSAEAREKLTAINASNKSVIYTDQLSEENFKWATDMKKTISDYLKLGLDGPYFYRMVETVLARDKNWVFWKMASCPPIQREAVTPAIFVEARNSAQRMATSKRLRPMPMGAVPLDFLREKDNDAALEELKAPERSHLPDLDSFQRKIADDDFEIDMPTNDETKVAAIAGKASKSWRALRIAARSKLVAFDKIDDPKKVGVVFEEVTEPGEDEDAAEVAAADEDMPQIKEPLIISGPPSVGKSALVERLMEKRKGIFGAVVRHALREPKESEVNGKDFHFVQAQEFNQLRDGDRLIEYGTRDGTEYGTSTKVIDAIAEAGKVPIIELDLEAAQFAKDMDFSARYVLVKPPAVDDFRERLVKQGLEESAVQGILDKLPQDLDETKTDELFNTVVISDRLDDAATMLEKYVYQEPETAAAAAADEEDAGMEDASS